MQEVEAPNQVSGKGGEAKGPATKPVSKGQPTKKKSGTDFKPVQAGVGPKGVGKNSTKIMETAEEEEEGKMSEGYEEEEEGKQMDEAGLTSEDLDEIIKELEAEVSGEEQGQHVEEPAAMPGAEGEPAPDDEMPPVGDDEKGDEPEKGDHEIPSPEHGDEEPVDINAEPGSEVNVGPEAGEESPEVPQLPPVPHVDNQDQEEEINLEELLAALNEEAEEEEEEGKVSEGYEEEEEEEGKKMDEISNNGVPKNVGGQDKSGGTNTYPKGPDASKKQLPGKNHNISGKGNIGSGSPDGKPMREGAEVVKYQTALNEAYETIKFLRGQINEVNLLNAKLLYTNKLFKEFATVIDEPYRMKIVEAFDLTKSVREVKLAYALLAESLNFGSKKVVASSKPISKIDPSKKAIARQITEGLASKPVASTKPAESGLILEDAQVSRFQKLAGIKKPIVESKSK